MTKYPLIRSKRKTIAIVIDRSGNVKIRAPKRVSIRSIKSFVIAKQGWILKTIEKIKKRQKEPKLRGVYLFGEKISDSDFNYEDEEAYKKELLKYSTDKIKDYLKLMNLDDFVIDLKLKWYKSKWGSCSYKKILLARRIKKAEIKLNLKLAAFPHKIVDYVIVHELCHIFEMNHSQKFWQKVNSYYPNHKESRKWLRTEGRKYFV